MGKQRRRQMRAIGHIKTRGQFFAGMSGKCESLHGHEPKIGPKPLLNKDCHALVMRCFRKEVDNKYACGNQTDP